MRKIIIFRVLIAVFILLALQQRNAEASNEIDLSLSIPKNVFQLGEIISVETKITNNSSTPVFLEGDSNSLAAIKIAFNEDANYKLYVSPVTSATSFTVDGVIPPIQIDPKKTLVKQVKVLCNDKPRASHLNADAAKPYMEGRILTDYAFPEAGTYYIKAVTSILKDKKPVLIESEPVKITIIEPTGEDLEVWNRIKDNGEFAFFIQEGEMTGGYHKPEEQAKFQADIQALIKQYPNSFLSRHIQQSLMIFQANENKRKTFFDKLKPEKR